MDLKLPKEFVITSVNAALMEHCMAGNSILEVACERESQRSTWTNTYCVAEDKIMGYFAQNASLLAARTSPFSSFLRGNAVRARTIRAFARRAGQEGSASRSFAAAFQRSSANLRASRAAGTSTVSSIVSSRARR